MSTIAWVGFSQGVFAAVLMFTKKENSVSDKILSAWLMLLAIEFLTCGLDHLIFGQPLLSSSFLLMNPAMYLYISSLTRPNFKLKWTQLLHLLPFLVFEIHAYIIQEPFLMLDFFTKNSNYTFRILFAAANFISWSIYNPLSLIYVHKHRMNLQNEKSNIEKNENLGWVLSVVVFYTIYCLVAVIIAIAVYFEGKMLLLPHVYNYAALLLVIYVLSFYGLLQQILPTNILVPVEDKSTSYSNSLLSDETKQKIKIDLLHYVESQNAYLNPDINMDLLSKELNTPKHQLTEVLNTVIGKNFFQFINAYRVEEVKKMLLDPTNNYSIEAIGYECGFSSKSSFYKEFKRLTGMTPVAYKSHYEQ